jgi:hypothetical protein
MRLGSGARAIAACAASFLVAACGGSGGSPSSAADGPSHLGVDLAYEATPTPRAAGTLARLAESDPEIARRSVTSLPADTWLIVRVTGGDFGEIACRFPKAGGRCDGIPAGAGRTVTVEEWNAAFDTLYFRGRQTGVAIERGRATRVRVAMRPPVVIRYPEADDSLRHRSFDAQVQSEPGAIVQLYLGSRIVGTATASASGLASIRVDRDPGATDSAGLAEGDYVLTAVAFPRLDPAGAPVRHVGAEHAFTVDLTPPVLQVSAPSLVDVLAVDASGVTEPGVALRCGVGDPDGALRPEVGADGRFAVLAVPIGEGPSTFSCDATDRAGNTTRKSVTVAYRPESFAVVASVADVTNRPTVPLAVATHWTVDALRIEVDGEDAPAPRVVDVPRQAEAGAFAVDLPLHLNQWNRVRVSALVAGVELGATEVAVEHDDVAPQAPTVAWSSGTVERWDGTALWYRDWMMGFSAEPGSRVQLAHWADRNYSAEWQGDLNTYVLSQPDSVLGMADTSTGIFRYPPGCYFHVYSRTIDRAGNVSVGWTLTAFPVLSSMTCVSK